MNKKQILNQTVDKINEKNNQVVVFNANDLIEVKNTSNKSITQEVEMSTPKKEKKSRSMFDKLYKTNVNDHVEEKGKFSYLSWAYAWAEVKKLYPKAMYKIKQFGENQLPYIYDDKTGYMVFTEVTIEDLTYTMWLPVMDNYNRAMKNPTMSDINKALMRCLVKNLAMFGLGLYIYAGEDLPEDDFLDECTGNENIVSIVKELKNMEQTLANSKKEY